MSACARTWLWRSSFWRIRAKKLSFFHNSCVSLEMCSKTANLEGSKFNLVLKKGSNLHLVNLFVFKNFGQRFFDLKSQKIVAQSF